MHVRRRGPFDAQDILQFHCPPCFVQFVKQRPSSTPKDDHSVLCAAKRSEAAGKPRGKQERARTFMSSLFPAAASSAAVHFRDRCNFCVLMPSGTAPSASTMRSSRLPPAWAAMLAEIGRGGPLQVRQATHSGHLDKTDGCQP